MYQRTPARGSRCRITVCGIRAHQSSSRRSVSPAARLRTPRARWRAVAIGGKVPRHAGGCHELDGSGDRRRARASTITVVARGGGDLAPSAWVVRPTRRRRGSSPRAARSCRASGRMADLTYPPERRISRRILRRERQMPPRECSRGVRRSALQAGFPRHPRGGFCKRRC